MSFNSTNPINNTRFENMPVHSGSRIFYDDWSEMPDTVEGVLQEPLSTQPRLAPEEAQAELLLPDIIETLQRFHGESRQALAETGERIDLEEWMGVDDTIADAYRFLAEAHFGDQQPHLAYPASYQIQEFHRILDMQEEEEGLPDTSNRQPLREMRVRSANIKAARVARPRHHPDDEPAHESRELRQRERMLAQLPNTRDGLVGVVRQGLRDDPENRQRSTAQGFNLIMRNRENVDVRSGEFAAGILSQELRDLEDLLMEEVGPEIAEAELMW